MNRADLSDLVIWTLLGGGVAIQFWSLKTRKRLVRMRPLTLWLVWGAVAIALVVIFTLTPSPGT